MLDLLDVDMDWHMHQISDGERRRVQCERPGIHAWDCYLYLEVCMGLMFPWDVLLLDEVRVLAMARELYAQNHCIGHRGLGCARA